MIFKMALTMSQKVAARGKRTQEKAFGIRTTDGKVRVQYKSLRRVSSRGRNGVRREEMLILPNLSESQKLQTHR